MNSLFPYPNFGQPDSVVQQVAEDMGLDYDLATLCQHGGDIEFGIMLAYAAELDARGMDFRPHIGREDDAEEFWRQPLTFLYASGAKALVWRTQTLSLGATGFVLNTPCRNAPKHLRGVALCEVHGTRRTTTALKKWNGLNLDDDGVIGRQNLATGYLRFSFGTANDGKSSELVPCDALAAENFSLTDEDVHRYLNRNCKYGNAYQAVRVGLAGNGGPEIVNVKGHAHVRVDFAPQQRTRHVIPFSRAIQGSLLTELIESPNGRERFCEAVEAEVLGRHGTDRACFEPMRVGYLPSGDKPDFYSDIIGPPKLFDPVPLAEMIIEHTPRRKTRTLHVVPMAGDVPRSLRNSLRGVRLASFIAANHPELVHRENALSPLVMRRCPFADGHSVKRGQPDNSLFCYDPDETPFPTVGCLHASCADRSTKDFVDALIEQGELGRDDVYSSSEYRDIYSEIPANDLLTPLAPNWRDFVNRQ